MTKNFVTVCAACGQMHKPHIACRMADLRDAEARRRAGTKRPKPRPYVSRLKVPKEKR